MISTEIELIDSSIKNGRVYFPICDTPLFPKDSFGDRAGSDNGGEVGKSVTFLAGTFTFTTDIRKSSSTRLSPRKTFAPYLKSIHAKTGDRLFISRVDDRIYLIKHFSS